MKCENLKSLPAEIGKLNNLISHYPLKLTEKQEQFIKKLKKTEKN